MKKTLFGLAAALAIAGASSLFIGASKPEAPKAAPAAAARVKWEYKAVAAKGKEAEDTMNELGKEGWELVSMTVTSSGLTFSYNMAFKRPLE